MAGEDFGAVEERALFEFLSAHIAQHEGLDVDVLRQEVEASLGQALDSVLSLMESIAFLSDEQAELDASRCVLRLRESRLRRHSENLGHLQQDARAQNDGDAVKQWGQMVNGLTKQLVRVQREEAAHTSLSSSRLETS